MSTWTGGKALTLREKQSLFNILKARLVLWVQEQGWCLTPGEGLVAQTDAADGDYDGPHRRGGAHYMGLGEDPQLFVGGTWHGDIYVGGRWVHEGGNEIWRKVGEKWESMHPLCRWGGRFGDDNHISLEHHGVK